VDNMFLNHFHMPDVIILQ